MGEVVTSVNAATSTLETNLVRKIDEGHQEFSQKIDESNQQFSSDLAIVKMQLAELTNNFKNISDAKKREGESGKKRRLL
ncbi:hypothetical protein F511_45299 [Dorcoceras hygrometricum]|uniref:Uncharacterized protein n=1 Tax=Dorcoceras hygrometricum TaxID=472368 RepID=A0A2Z6ZWJ1_9LAMI|nr:hypothetical protein F511_45299 [Dorcoceras hygrometricum]